MNAGLNRWLAGWGRCLLWLVTVGLAGAVSAADFGVIGLTDGSFVLGRFALQRNGIFQFTDVGGKLYHWHEIRPFSLPLAVREQVRGMLLERLAQAQGLYDREEFAAATEAFKEVVGARGFLHRADVEAATWPAVEKKAQGLVWFQGEWVTFARKQELLGLVLYQGRWVTREQAELHRIYTAALAQARRSTNYVQAALDLKDLTNRFPTSPYNEVVQKLIDQLLAKAEGGATSAAVVAVPRPSAPEPQPTVNRISFSINDDSYTPLRHWRSRPMFVYRGKEWLATWPGYDYWGYEDGDGHGGHRGHDRSPWPRHNDPPTFRIRF